MRQIQGGQKGWSRENYHEGGLEKLCGNILFYQLNVCVWGGGDTDKDTHNV